jgi:hypothetical protein
LQHKEEVHMTEPIGRKLHYAWIVAAETFLTLLATAGIGSTPGC